MSRDQEKRRDNFMRLARMANVVPVDHFYVTDVFLEKFAEMVAAEEREVIGNIILKYAERDDLSDSDESLLKHLFDLIRARCET